MFNVLDYAILIIVFLSMIQGWRTGLIRSAGNLFILLAAILLALLYADDLNIYLEQNFAFETKIDQWLMSKLPVLVFNNGFNEPGLVNENLLTAANINLTSLVSTAAAFLIILAAVYIAGHILFKLLNSTASEGSLKIVNGFLGMLFHAVKILLIIIVVIGLIYEPLHSGEQIGIHLGGKITSLVDASWSGQYLIPLFLQLKFWIINTV
ncbi:MAG: CvpA family protein [Syntrophomonadaceae bacterium]|jgi:uncharacterized membrane protein required for colicin V production|nr:CvpA family protein [Syntrophomonadaceae bacterium]